VIFVLSAADNGIDGGIVPRSTARVFILELFDTILASDPKFTPPAFEGAIWHPDSAQLLVIIDFAAKNFGPGVLPVGFGSESSLLEQENVIPVAITMLRINISFLIGYCLK
jgi:hypothetical protein